MKKYLFFLILHLRDLKSIKFLLDRTPFELKVFLRKTLFTWSPNRSHPTNKALIKFELENNPLVSIVIPNYNHAEFLGSAIESVLNQSYTNIEVLVVDDGSTDNSQEILAKFRSESRVSIMLREHLGLTQALNYGFLFATGSILTWTSADNLMNKFGLQTLVKSLNENCYVGMVYGDYSLIDDKGNLLRDSSFRKYDQDQADNCIIRTFRLNNINRYLPDNFIGPFFAYRKEIMSLIGPYKELRGFEDYDYWLRINKVCEISHVPSKGDLYFYRIHHNTLTSKAKETKTYRRLIRYLKTQEFGT